MAKKIEVSCCKECPFFRETLGALIAAAFGRDSALGECDCPTKSGVRWVPAGTPGPEAERIRDERASRLRVFKADEIPKECPLRKDDLVIGVRYVN